jgi:AcrR family transcriptional regulator
MPRHIDPEVEGRILEAARKLWHKGGERALSMRAVARAAGTNTPAVYRRFHSREDILRAVVRSYQQELLATIQPCRSLQEVARCYLDFALRRPKEYQLIMSGLLARISEARPSLNYVVDQTSQWLGGTAGDHRALVYALAALADGTSMFTITGFLPPEDLPILHAAFGKAIEVLVANEAKFRNLHKSHKSLDEK